MNKLTFMLIIVLSCLTSALIADEKKMGTYDENSHSSWFKDLFKNFNTQETGVKNDSNKVLVKDGNGAMVMDKHSDSSQMVDMFQGFKNPPTNGDGFSMMSTHGNSIISTITNLSEDFSKNPVVQEIKVQLNKVLPSGNLLDIYCTDNQPNC